MARGPKLKHRGTETTETLRVVCNGLLALLGHFSEEKCPEGPFAAAKTLRPTINVSSRSVLPR